MLRHPPTIVVSIKDVVQPHRLRYTRTHICYKHTPAAEPVRSPCLLHAGWLRWPLCCRSPVWARVDTRTRNMWGWPEPYVYGVYTVLLQRGLTEARNGQVFIRSLTYTPRNHQIYGHIRCVHTALAYPRNMKHGSSSSLCTHSSVSVCSVFVCVCTVACAIVCESVCVCECKCVCVCLWLPALAFQGRRSMALLFSYQAIHQAQAAN